MKNVHWLASLSLAALAVASCATTPPTAVTSAPAPAAATAPASANPFFTTSPLPFGAPQFGSIAEAHYREALDRGMTEHRAEITAIANNAAPATFDNTILAMERSGKLLERTQLIFGNMASANTNPEIQAIQREYAPRLAAHNSAINLNASLFARIDALYQKRDSLKLTAEQKRVLERYAVDAVFPKRAERHPRLGAGAGRRRRLRRPSRVLARRRPSGRQCARPSGQRPHHAAAVFG